MKLLWGLLLDSADLFTIGYAFNRRGGGVHLARPGVYLDLTAHLSSDGAPFSFFKESNLQRLSALYVCRCVIFYAL